MSSERQPPDDRELEAFLDGEHPASKAYAGARHEPPAHLDATVLQLARAAAAPRARSGWRRWRAPLAAAAMLVLAVGVVLRLPERAPPPSAAAFEERKVQSEAMTASEPTVIAQPAPASAGVPPPTVPAPAARKPPPPLAAMKREAPAASVQSAPTLSVAPPPPPMAPAPVQATADAAGDAAPADEGVANGDALAPRAEQRALAAAEMSAQATRKQKAAALPGPTFDGLLVGASPREAVHARYGEPSKPATPSAEAVQLRDRYEQLPGHAGGVEFVYEAASQRLLTVIESLPPGTTASALTAQEGGAAPAHISDRAPAQCVVAEAWPDAQYYLFTERRVYWIVDRAGDVRRIIYDSGCADFD